VPWENEFTFIGTTDVDFKDNLDSFSASDDEINYLCKSANQYFRSNISSNDVIKHWSGVRPLYDDGSIKAQKASRDYTIRIDSQNNNSALINLFGYLFLLCNRVRPFELLLSHHHRGGAHHSSA
jgi:glycerol-3-phosphate dehydrogenase